MKLARKKRLDSKSWKDSDRPQFCSEWTFEQPDAGKFIARSESDARVLAGRVVAAVLPRIDGQRTVAELVHEAPPEIRRKVRPTLNLLEEQGLITRKPDASGSRAELAYWRLTGADESVVAQRRAQATCRVGVLSDTAAQQIGEELSSLGVLVSDNAAFRLVVIRDYLDEQLDAINRECFGDGVSWMLVRPYGRKHWIGPLFVPRRTGCWECLAWWLTVNGWSASSVVAELPVLTATTLRLAAVEAGKWLLAGRAEAIEGRIREFDTGSLEFTNHWLIPRTVCPHCQSIAGTSLELRATLSPLTGVTARLEGLKEWPGLAVYTGEGSQTLGMDGEGGAYYCSRHTTFGAAETAAQAASVCMAEGVERFCARFQGDETIFAASARTLGQLAVGPTDLLLPKNMHDRDVVIGWVKATSLLSSEQKYLPAGYVYLGYDNVRFEANTNGCAAGITMEAATTTALLELIERDALALWWYTRARRPALDLEMIRWQRIDTALAVAGECGKRVHVLDLTTDFGVPVCVAVAVGEAPGLALGCAAHSSLERCVWKALAGMSTVMARLAAPPAHQHHWLQHARIEDHPHLQPWGRSARREDTTMENAALVNLLERAKGLSLDVLRVDLTRGELGIPVVRLVAPGLRPVEPKILAPGRLYDVPVSLGWIPKVLSEEQMNPMPFVL